MTCTAESQHPLPFSDIRRPLRFSWHASLTRPPSSSLSFPVDSAELGPPDASAATGHRLLLPAEADSSPSTSALRHALNAFHPRTAQYAQVPYEAAFNWDELDMELAAEGQWYCVAFRSIRQSGTEDDQALYAADRVAHEEAVHNGGLLLYWYGRPDEQGANLATCIWESRAHATAANVRPRHIAAVRLAARAYASYTLERYTLRKVRGERKVRIEPFVA